MPSNSIGLNSLNTYTDKNVASLLKSQNIQKDTSNAKLREASDSFESFFVQQMLEISMKNLNIAGEQTGSKIMKGMYIETMSKSTAGSMGISDLVYDYLKDQQNDLTDPNNVDDLKKLDEALKKAKTTSHNIKQRQDYNANTALLLDGFANRLNVKTNAN
jgi:Rod binding domain-containing protein